MAAATTTLAAVFEATAATSPTSSCVTAEESSGCSDKVDPASQGFSIYSVMCTMPSCKEGHAAHSARGHAVENSSRRHIKSEQCHCCPCPWEKP